MLARRTLAKVARAYVLMRPGTRSSPVVLRSAMKLSVARFLHHK
ncbi:hypothetical protein ABEV34_26160 [Methylorubrum rhodesianum]